MVYLLEQAEQDRVRPLFHGQHLELVIDGLATLTARAFVVRCVREGIAPHWDCWTTNLPSVAVAEKVGFVKALEYTVWFGKMNGAGRWKLGLNLA